MKKIVNNNRTIGQNNMTVMKDINTETYKETEQKVPLMFTIDELANKSSLSSYTIRRWVKEGNLPCIKIGKKHLISWDNFCRFLNSNMGVA